MASEIKDETHGLRDASLRGVERWHLGYLEQETHLGI